MTVEQEQKMRHPFLVGERVYFRPLEEADLDGPWADWLNDYEVTKFLETGMFPSTPESLHQYLEDVSRNPNNVMLAIIETANGQHIGNIKLGPINRLHRFADLAIMIGAKECWGKGYAREAWEMMVVYGFERQNLHKITLGVYADHDVAAALYRKIGFKIEGTLRNHLFRDGAYHDKYLMGMLHDEYLQLTQEGRFPRKGS